jgi:hypothetical protein
MGYAWAAAAVIIALATFFGHNYFSSTLAISTGVTVNPRFSGGQILKTIDHGKYKTAIHRPVFDSLIGQTKEGFIQINWEPAAGLPPIIREGFDYNQDGNDDFTITLNTTTGETMLTKNSPDVLDVGKSYRLKNGWAVRVLLKR